MVIPTDLQHLADEFFVWFVDRICKGLGMLNSQLGEKFSFTMCLDDFDRSIHMDSPSTIGCPLNNEWCFGYFAHDHISVSFSGYLAKAIDSPPCPVAVNGFVPARRGHPV
jgi:hypothetical protein